MSEMRVRPARKGMGLRHPVAGDLPDEGGLWPADQFTFARIVDRDIVEAPDDPPADAVPADDPKPAGPALKRS
ncbi:hypothetical protein [Chelatococcus reniformis]|uniref:Uncharacterized protein n=1 Tax=Chelatococcus reniformis TaxID=1494448 RepID=A0A916XQ37_9HYPH|nr:hypothetical protein [Chelatococcus reniformis]GGC90375.1 hypothetical protein GCM10010994_55250 [Chelatococcus reniformis]